MRSLNVSVKELGGFLCTQVHKYSVIGINMYQLAQVSEFNCNFSLAKTHIYLGLCEKHRKELNNLPPLATNDQSVLGQPATTIGQSSAATLKQSPLLCGDILRQANLGESTQSSGTTLGKSTLLSGDTLGHSSLSSADILGQSTLSSGGTLGHSSLSSGATLGQSTLSTGDILGQSTLSSRATLEQSSLSSVDTLGQFRLSSGDTLEQCSFPIGDTMEQFHPSRGDTRRQPRLLSGPCTGDLSFSAVVQSALPSGSAFQVADQPLHRQSKRPKRQLIDFESNRFD